MPTAYHITPKAAGFSDFPLIYIKARGIECRHGQSMQNQLCRPLLSILLALCLILGSVATGMAAPGPQHLPGTLTEVVICSATGGEATILIDAEGRPADPARSCPAHPCPDCITADPAALPVQGLAGRVGMPVAPDHAPRRIDAPASGRLSLPVARGPPLRDLI
jgi:hypothetical protein